MAVLAEYRAPAPPGNAVRLGIQAYETGSSIMARKQQLRLMEQQQNLQQMEFIAKLPLLQAQTQLEQANAAAAIDNGVTQTQLETKAALESPAAIKEFNDAVQYQAPRTYRVLEDGSVEEDADQEKWATQATYEARVTKLSALSAKYAYMAGLKKPGFSGFHETINKALIEANESLHADLKLKELLAAQQIRTAGTVEARTIGAGATVEAAKISADARGASDASKATFNADRIIALKAAADATDDPALADALRANITRLNAVPAAKGRRPLPAAVAATLGIPATAPTDSAPATPSKPATVHVPTVQTPQGTRPIPKGTKTIKVDGQEYPLSVDANGNRAYYKDGDWVDLPARR